MSKMLNVGAAATASFIGDVTVARVRVREGVLQLRFGNRVNTSNLPKGEQLRSIGTKASGRRISLPDDLGDVFEPGDKVVFIPAKYGWVSAHVATAMDGLTLTGSVSAK